MQREEIAVTACNTPIQSLWIGERLTTMEVLSIRSFLANGHPYHLYTYGPVANVPSGATIRDAEEILPRDRIFRYGKAAGDGSGSVAGFADHFRYQLLFQRGGIWADTDLVCLKPLAFASDYVIGSEMRHPRDRTPYPTNSLLKAPPGSDFARYCCEVCTSKDPERLHWGETGPRLVETLVNDNTLLHRYVAPYEAFCPVHYFNMKQLLAPGLRVNLSNSYAVHLWNEMWRRYGYDKDRSYHPTCLYEQLKTRYLN